MTGPDLSVELAFAHELADLADGLSLPGFGRHGRDVADTKSDGSWVTAIDTGVERALRAAIVARFPGHAVLGEEEGRVGPADAPTWVLDPIDGTSNYVRGNPVWATLVGLRIDDVDVLGVVSAPALGSRWDGVVGVGAHHDGQPIRVSTVADMGEAEVSFCGVEWMAEKGRAGLWDALSTTCGRVRGYGDFWQHMLVAGGSSEIAIDALVSTWDLVAVRAVVEAAGGRATTLDGRATSDGGELVSTNGRLHDAVLGLAASTGGGDASSPV